MTTPELAKSYMTIQDDRPIGFVETIWHYLSPFSAHQIEMWGEHFATVEHAYHCARLLPGPARDEVKNSKSPLDALRISQKYKNDPKFKKPDFDKYAVMEELFRAKLEQHPHVAEILKLTGTRGLLKDISTDYDWGTGADGSGQNTMGKLWMKLRAELFGQ